MRLLLVPRKDRNAVCTIMRLKLEAAEVSAHHHVEADLGYS